MTDTPESPFARWSRRKLTRRTAPKDLPPAEPEALEPAAALEATPAPEEEAIDESTLADPETLNAGDDFTAYLGKGISSGLRRRALRRLWTTNPVLANLDGLNDYDDDYTAIGPPGGLLKTAYKAGRGFLSDPEPVDKGKAGDGNDAPRPDRTATATTTAAAPHDQPDTASLDAPVARMPAPTELGDRSVEAPGEPETAAATTNPPVRRRMRFTVTDA